MIANLVKMIVLNIGIINSFAIFKQGAGSMERLSLTLEEVMHIRNVLTKAELESLLVKPDLHDLVAKGKVSFLYISIFFFSNN